MTGPSLVLVHGSFSDHQTNWEFVRPRFEKQFTVYAMARRGRGETDASEGHSLEDEGRTSSAAIVVFDRSGEDEMEIRKTLYVTSREKWRAWLTKHYQSETEVWLIYYKKHTGQPRIAYDHAVEEALCFGWIDSIVKRIDDEKFAQKFTPRRNSTKWSALNKRRLRKLIREGRMTKAGLAKIDRAVLDEEAPAKQSKGNLDIPRFVKQALMANAKAWKNFQNFAPSYRRHYIQWIMDAKREETRERRLREAVSLLEQNKKLGLK